ncbi:MAG: flippase-like domain-containing protein [Clostridia bacterium]|nr:flippase-like domain-containing protein [Clostridia bacterium]
MENTTVKKPLDKKKIALFVVYGIIAVFLFITILSFNDLGAIGEQLKMANWSYMLIALLCILAYMALFPLSLCILTRSRRTKVNMGTTYCIAMTEHFFNGITPLQTGGQPFQAYSFSKAKVKVSESTGLLLANFLIYMIATNVFSLLSLIYFNDFLAKADTWWIVVTVVGFVMNFLVLAVTVVLGMSRTVRGWLIKLIHLLCKIKFLKKFLEPKAESLETYFVQVQEAFGELMKKKWHFLFATFTKLLAYAALYVTNFFILLALNIPVGPENMFFILCGTAFAITAVVFVPTPGASGGAEQSFLVVFGAIIGAGASAAAASLALMWRLFSYYLVMLVSLFFYVGLEVYFGMKKKKLSAVCEECDGGDISDASGDCECGDTACLGEKADTKIEEQ